MAFQQATRALQAMTPFGADAIQLIGFEGEEEVSRLGGFQLELISENPSLDPAQIVGQNITFVVTDNDDKTRFFNGFVNRFAAGAVNDDGIRRYRATVVPWLWFLTQTTDCRIFQDKTVIEIVEQIFQDLGFQDFSKSQVRDDHPKREYCVQYRESDFDFVSRLLEEEGVFYFFEHQNGKHTLVLSDQPGAHETVEQSPVDYPNSDHYSWSIKPHLYTWESSFEFRTGKWAHTDYNFKAPRDRLMASETGVLQLPGVDKFEAYEFPGEYEQKSVGKPLAKIRAEELACQHHLIETSSTCVSFVAGGRFKIGKHRVAKEEGKEYVIKKLTHRAFFAEAYETHGIEYRSDEPAYFNQIICFPHSIPFRPVRSTPRPVVRGCQTAVVTGPPGEEIYPDEFGRVKVQFHWDREGQYDDKSSCWIRVSQIHAGKGWGYMDLPRIGEEVIVDFLEGNPDQPIIVGRVYNGDNRPPFELPAGKTRRGNSTKTYKGAGFNEMSMDDTPGKEQLRVNAQYDMNSNVNNDQTLNVGNNQSEDVGNDQTKNVGNNRTRTVGNNESVTVGVNRDVSVGTNHSEKIGSNQSVNIGSSQSVSIGSKQSINVGSMKNETVGMISNEMVGAMKTTNVGAVYSVISGAAMNTAVGFISSEQVGMTKKIIVGSKLEIIVGASKLVMEAGGKVTIEGCEFLFSASGNVKINGSVIDLN
jgi:type VI secretion system secreted protein VgrG